MASHSTCLPSPVLHFPSPCRTCDIELVRPSPVSLTVGTSESPFRVRRVVGFGDVSTPHPNRPPSLAGVESVGPAVACQPCRLPCFRTLPLPCRTCDTGLGEVVYLSRFFSVGADWMEGEIWFRTGRHRRPARPTVPEGCRRHRNRLRSALSEVSAAEQLVLRRSRRFAGKAAGTVGILLCSVSPVAAQLSAQWSVPSDLQEAGWRV